MGVPQNCGNFFDDIRGPPPSVSPPQSIFQNPYVKWGAGSVCAVVIFRLGMYIIDTINEPYRYSKNFDDTTVIDKHHEEKSTEVVKFVRGALYSLTYPFSKWIKHSIQSVQSARSNGTAASQCTCKDRKDRNQKRVVSPWIDSTVTCAVASGANACGTDASGTDTVVTVKKIE